MKESTIAGVDPLFFKKLIMNQTICTTMVHTTSDKQSSRTFQLDISRTNHSFQELDKFNKSAFFDSLLIG